MGNSFGQSWVDTDTPTRQRMNWKSIIVDAGANLAALDYVTGLVSRYAFGGNPNDSYGSNNLTAHGSPTPTFPSTGIYGSSIQLVAASSQYLTAANSTIFDQTTNNFWFTFWVNMSSLPTAGNVMYFLSKRNGQSPTNAGYAVYIDQNGKINAELSDGTTLFTAIGGTALSLSKWYFIEIHYNRGSNIQIYVNAVQDASIAQGTSTSITNTQVFTVGSRSDTPALFLDGQLDQLQIFTGGPPSAAVIHQIYSDCHSGMLAFCTVTGSGFTSGTLYRRNVENTAWEQVVDLTSTQTLSNKTLDNTNTIAQDLFSIFLQQQANVIVNALYHAVSSLYATSNSGTGSVTASYTTTENRIDVATGATTGSTGQIVLPSGTFDGSTYITNSPNSNQWFFIAGLEARGSTNTGDYMEVCICSNTLLSTTKTNSFGLFVSGTGNNWQAYAANNSSSFTNVDTGIASTAAVYGVMANFLAANTVKVYANHILKATITTNVPNSGAGTVLRAFVQNGSTNNRILTVIPAMILAGVKA
jgi:hypothetical protein